VRRDIAQWLAKWQTKYPRLCNWVEDNIEETLTLNPAVGDCMFGPNRRNSRRWTPLCQRFGLTLRVNNLR
jgi:hypothetical protein